jgi:hypothetical protein
VAKSKKMIFWLIPSLVIVAALVSLLYTSRVRALDGDCPPGQTLQCSMVGNQVVCKCGGSDNGGGTSTPGSGGDATPTPGGIPSCIETYYKSFGPAGPGRCYGAIEHWDVCSNPNKLLDWHIDFFPCGGGGTPTPPPPISPCKDLNFDPTSGTINCEWNFQWELAAGVSMPPIVIDARPYPVTLVNWPTAMRVNGLAEASGSGTLAYAGWGGGTPTSTAVGDWRDITLTLTFRPTGNPVSVSLMKQDVITVPSSGGALKIFTWQVPSHPAVGATRTAGEVGQLGEIPSDIPLFEGHSQTTYRLFYNLSYQEYSKQFVCYDTATPTPNYWGTPGPSCVHGAWVGSWDGKSKSGEILPSQVDNLPPAMNGGNVFNDFSVVIRRMDENGSTSNPKYAHQYSWGSIFYWACREGQGQVGWPEP